MDGRTLQELLAVTREELAARMDSGKLIASTQDSEKKFSAWMTQTHWPHLSEQVAGHVCGFLQENLASVFAGAWNKYSELKRYAKQTREDATSTVDVALADHDFTYELSPSVDVLLDGVKVAHIPFSIAVTFAVNGLELALKHGCVERVSSGRCDCKAAILCADNEIWSRALAGVNLPGELHLAKPIALDA
jgi:hypothetical protein